MSIYGEGLYRDSEGQTVSTQTRSFEQLKGGHWELLDASGAELKPVPTPEEKPATLESVYALSKYDQERLCLMTGRAYGFPVVALRFFNVYGPRQALSNPYTGVLSIFSARLLNGRPPLVFEDGLQRRDFVSVHDVARACLLSLENSRADGQVLNVGSGRSLSILDVASEIARALGKTIAPEISGKYRVGDIRHCFADIGRAERLLGYRPEVTFAKGLSELAESLIGQLAHDRVAEARAELEARGLTL
jgi:dTDP-L-rhamnose 4-epimerase